MTMKTLKNRVNVNWSHIDYSSVKKEKAMKSMSMYANKNKKKRGKVAVLTKDGSKLIGIIVELDDSVKSNPDIAFIINSGQEGIWLRRKNHISFLGDDNIKLIRSSRPGEKEID